MFSLFNKKKNENLPDCWLEYLSNFSDKFDYNSLIDETRFIILDTETTGYNSKTDKILSIGAIKIEQNQIDTSNTFEVFLEQSDFNPNVAPIHGIRKNGNIVKETEQNAIRQLVKYIGNDIIVGHSISFDIEIINETLKKYVSDKLKNTTLDTINLYKRLKGADFKIGTSTSLDSLSDEFNITKSDRHNAAGDSLITAILFMKLISRLKKRGVNTIGDLIKTRRVLM